MPRPVAHDNRAMARELLEMAERGLPIPPSLVAFALREDWTGIDCRRPALAAIDLLIAAEVADEFVTRLRRPPPC